MGRIREFVEYVRGDHDPRFVSPERRILEYFGIIEARPVTLDEARFRAVIAERTIFGEGPKDQALHKILQNGQAWDVEQWQQYECFLEGHKELREAMRQLPEIAPHDLDGPER